ncbi:MAG: site-specific integrase [Dehalococcoidia bacterium]|nr:MAG: site-specific integrase [Dehalococcoidia bacterium]
MNHTYGERRLRWLPEVEVRQIIARSANPLLLDTVFFYGLRRSEVGLIKRSDVERDGIWITALKRRKPFRQFMPLVEPLKSKLLKYLMSHGHEYLFPGYSGHGVSGEMVAKIWRDAAPKGVSAHVLRHSRAMAFSEKGMPIEDCSYWLRHSSIKSTECYYKISATRAKNIALAMA